MGFMSAFCFGFEFKPCRFTSSPASGNAADKGIKSFRSAKGLRNSWRNNSKNKVAAGRGAKFSVLDTCKSYFTEDNVRPSTKINDFSTIIVKAAGIHIATRTSHLIGRPVKLAASTRDCCPRGDKVANPAIPTTFASTSASSSASAFTSASTATTTTAWLVPQAQIDPLLGLLNSPYCEDDLEYDCPEDIFNEWYETQHFREEHHRSQIRKRISAMLQQVQPRTLIVGFELPAGAAAAAATADRTAALDTSAGPAPLSVYVSTPIAPPAQVVMSSELAAAAAATATSTAATALMATTSKVRTGTSAPAGSIRRSALSAQLRRKSV